MAIADPEVSEWTRRIFDHPDSDPAWYWSVEFEDQDESFPDGDDAVNVRMLTAIFGNPELYLSQYSDVQVRHGLWFLAPMSSPGRPAWLSLLVGDVPWESRRAGIESMYTLFRDMFGKRCAPSIATTPDRIETSLDNTCFLWWGEMLPCSRPFNAPPTREQIACLQVMERVLGLDSVACQESALHGLGHWCQYSPDIAGPIIDRFLASGRVTNPKLREYAERARNGYIQ